MNEIEIANSKKESLGRLETPSDFLLHYFGYDSFLGCQSAVVNRTIGGLHSLVVMPTGGGKSLCFQIPALYLCKQLHSADRPSICPPICIVISPLIALMQDQVDGLRQKGIHAAFINSSLDADERRDRYQAVSRGIYDLLYVTPERFRKPDFVEVLRSRSVVLLAIDEAHCISQWGHDFRPDYTRMLEFRDLLGNPTTISLTATATPEVQLDIIDQLGLNQDPSDKNFCQIYHEGIERPGLKLSVTTVWGIDEKINAVVESVNRWGLSTTHPVKPSDWQPTGSGIVYFTLIKTLIEFSDRLREQGIHHLRYHGDLDRRSRRGVQEAFMQNEIPLVLATNAFGMGIDKPDIRAVIHADLPNSMESYYQEIGRAGRDGLDAECRLLYDQDDLMTQMEFIRWCNPDADFYHRLHDLLVNDSDRVRSFGIEWLREQLFDRKKHDRRLETALSMLERFGVIDSDQDLTNYSILSPLVRELADAELRSSKLIRDQKRLYALVQYVQHEGDRFDYLRQYFGTVK